MNHRQKFLACKVDIQVLIVTNTTALQRFIEQETLQAAFAHVATLLKHPQPQIRQLRNAVTATSSLQGLYTPAGFAKAAKEMNTWWTSAELLTKAILQQSLHKSVVKVTKLLHCPHDIFYTGASKREVHSYRICCIQTGSRCSPGAQGAPNRTRRTEHYQSRRAGIHSICCSRMPTIRTLGAPCRK